jgi:hypothetical protein
MTDEIEWGPWIEHDGRAPQLWSSRQWPVCHTVVEDQPGKINFSGGTISPRDPRFYWAWRRVRTGWFKSTRCRICDDPAYAPIIRYRLGRPRAQSIAFTRLADIVATPSQPVTGPEGPRRPAPLPYHPAGRLGRLRPGEKGGMPGFQGSGEYVCRQYLTAHSGRLGRLGRVFPPYVCAREKHGAGVTIPSILHRQSETISHHVWGKHPPYTPQPPQTSDKILEDMANHRENYRQSSSLFQPDILPSLPP